MVGHDDRGGAGLLGEPCDLDDAGEIGAVEQPASDGEPDAERGHEGDLATPVPV